MSEIFAKEQTEDIKKLEKEGKKFRRPTSVIEYAQLNFDLLTDRPFSPVDSLILSQMAYMDFGGDVPGFYENRESVTLQSLYRAEKFEDYTKCTYVPANNRRLLAAVCANPRFRDIKINYFLKSYDGKQEKQFAAITFFLPTGEMYVAFRGTDSTITGWKEDFNMFYMDTIPGQLQAVDYLKKAMDKNNCPVIVGGHSKGGNLALYSASFIDKERNGRIVKVYNHDGFGITKNQLERRDYIDMEEKTDTTVPYASIIGQIFTNGIYTVVASRGISIWQHDPFTWEVKDGCFVREKKIKGSRSGLIDAVYEVMETLEAEDRELFVDTVFEFINSIGAEKFGEVIALSLKRRDKVIRTMKSIEPDTREKVKNVLGELIKLTLKKSFVPGDGENGIISGTLNVISGTKDKIINSTAEKLEGYWSRIEFPEEDTVSKQVYIQCKI